MPRYLCHLLQQILQQPPRVRKLHASTAKDTSQERETETVMKKAAVLVVAMNRVWHVFVVKAIATGSLLAQMV
jgi:hypothetical protein